MDPTQFKTMLISVNELRAQNSDIIKCLKLNNELQRDTLKATTELLNFFVAIDERESDTPSVNSEQYLAELSNDGFRPPKD